MASSVSDSERRSEIAERTRSGLEEDLEDLRASLGADLREFERLVESTIESPPEWTGLTPTQLRAPFEFRRERLEEEAWIGPRLVAILAGRVEVFVTDWLPAPGEADGEGFAAGEVDRLEKETRRLVERFETIEPQLAAAAEDGHVILDELWETTLARLDEYREGEIDALEDLVDEGSLDTGPDARQERAHLWDEQRRKAERLRERWEALHDLIDEGTDYAIEGVADLRGMVRRACEGLEGAYPCVAEAGLVGGIVDGSEASAQEAPTQPAVEADAGGEGAGGDGESAEKIEPGSDRDDGETEKSGGEGEKAEEGDEAEEAGEAAEPREETPSAPVDEERAGSELEQDMETVRADGGEEASSDTVDQWLRKDSSGGRTAEPEESGKEVSGRSDEAATRPMITSAGEVRAGVEDSSELLAPEAGPREAQEFEESSFGGESIEESNGPDEQPRTEGSEPAADATAAEPAEPGGADDRNEVRTDGENSSFAGEGEGDPAVEPTLPAEEASEPADTSGPPERSNSQADASSPDDEEMPEAMAVGCLRIQTEWQPVAFRALFAALGPPVGFLVGIVGLALMHLVGLVSVNPVTGWSWTEPAVAVAFVWCVCAPMLLRWYPRWSGWRFQFVHETDVREDAALSLEREGFYLDEIAFPWESIQHFRLRRWEAADEEMVGWLLVVEPAYQEALELIAPAPDRRRWEEGDGAVLEPPTEAWQVEPEVLDRMTAFLERSSSRFP